MVLPPTYDSHRLAAWQAAERVPVFVSDEPHVWRMLAAAWEREAVEFRYWGGSSLGTLRKVSPEAVFTVAGCSGLYAEGYCHSRGENRVFRLDRVEWVDAPEVLIVYESPRVPG